VIIKSGVQIGRIPIMLRSEKCVLNGMSDEDQCKVKECKYDPGGYFVVKGVEKVILMQEQLSKNRAIIELDANNNVAATITSSTHDRKSRCSIFFKNDRIYLKSSSLGDDVPIVIILKAMGLESDQEVVQMVGCEPELMDLFAGSIEEPYTAGIFCKQQALQYIGNRVKSVRANSLAGAKSYRKNYSPEVEAMEILAHGLLNHVPVENYCFRSKVIYIAHIVRRLLRTVLDRSLLDDKVRFRYKSG
jgi:DNA-directed RNA polymerase III subunit RPC2